MRLVICGLFLLTSITVSSQNVKRAYKSLEKRDYEKALEQFNDAFNEDKTSASATLGLALIYSEENLPYFDLLEAWRKIKITEKGINAISAEDIEIITEYYLNTEERKSSRPVKKKIQITQDEILDKFIKLIREGNDLVLVNRVLNEFPDFRYYDNTVHIRNYLEFRSAEKANSIDAYKTFIDKFPEAAQVPQAKRQMHELAFSETKKINSFEAYTNFIHSYPAAEQIPQAVKGRDHAAFMNAKKLNTIEAYEDFINDYPDALDIMEARNNQMGLIYERALEINTIEGYNNFISKYPAGKQYVDIFNLKARELGKSYLTLNKYTDFQPAWVRAFDNNQKSEHFAVFAGDLQLNGVIIANTVQSDSLGYNAWIIGLDENTKMQWNKIVGDKRDDWVYDAKIDSKGNIVACGYTNSSIDTLDGEAWIFKLDKNGKKIWNRSIKYPLATSIDINSNDEILVGGYYTTTPDTNKFYLTKLNENGKKLWRREYVNTGSLLDLSFDDQNNIITGAQNWLIKLDDQGYILWENYMDSTITLKALDVADDGSIIVLGQQINMPWMARFTTDGQKMWVKNNFAVGYDSIYVTDVAIGPLSAVFSGSADNDAIIVKTNLNGEITDIKQYGTSANYEVIQKIRKMNSDMFIFGLTGKIENNADVLLMMITP